MITTTTNHFIKEINTYRTFAKNGQLIEILCADGSVLKLQKEEEGKDGEN